MGPLKEQGKGFWMALDGDRPVARLGAMVHSHEGEQRIHFGFFECCEGFPEAVPLLFDEAQKLGPTLELHGPYNFTMEDPYVGLLVEGFEHEPVFLSPYNPPYYEKYLQDVGLEQMMDLYSFSYKSGEVATDKMASRAKRAADKGISVRIMDKFQQARDMKICTDIADIALAGNWGFEAVSPDQSKILLLFCRLFFDPKTTLFARHSDKDIGFLWGLRDYNEFLRDGKGRITLRLIWRLLTQRQSISGYRGYALAVLPEFQKYPIAPALIHAMTEQLEDYNWKSFEVCWIVATNRRMTAMAVALGGQRSRVFRLYKRTPNSSSENK